MAPAVDDLPTESEALDAYSRVVTTVSERLAPALPTLRITRRTRGGRMPTGGGSAVVLTPDRFLLSNAHVVAGRGAGGGAAVGTRRARVVRRRPRDVVRDCRPRRAVRPGRPARRRPRPEPRHAGRRRAAAR